MQPRRNTLPCGAQLLVVTLLFSTVRGDETCGEQPPLTEFEELQIDLEVCSSRLAGQTSHVNKLRERNGCPACLSCHTGPTCPTCPTCIINPPSSTCPPTTTDGSVRLNATAASFNTPRTALPNCPASNCIDGDHTTLKHCLAGSSLCHSDQGVGNFLMVDLGSAKQVKSIRVYNRLDCCRERLGQHEVWIGDSSSGPLANTLCSSKDAMSALVVDHECTAASGGIAGRYVYVLQTGAARVLNLQEVAVYGTAIPPPAIFTDDGSYVFDGTAATVVSLAHVSMPQGNSDRTISFIMRTTHSRGTLFSSGTPTFGKTFNIKTTSGGGCIGVMGYNKDFYPNWCMGAAINDGVEHSVAVTYSTSSVVSMYVDGEIASVGHLPDLNTQGGSNYLGRSNHVGAEGYFVGSIRSLKVYDYALSAAQIRAQS